MIVKRSSSFVSCALVRSTMAARRSSRGTELELRFTFPIARSFRFLHRLAGRPLNPLTFVSRPFPLRPLRTLRTDLGKKLLHRRLHSSKTLRLVPLPIRLFRWIIDQMAGRKIRRCRTLVGRVFLCNESSCEFPPGMDCAPSSAPSAKANNSPPPSNSASAAPLPAQTGRDSACEPPARRSQGHPPARSQSSAAQQQIFEEQARAVKSRK